MGLIEPTPTATPIPCPAVPAGWTKGINHEFDVDVNDDAWPLGEDTDAYADTNMEIKDGVLRWSLRAHQNVYYHIEPRYSNDSRRDFYLFTRVRQVSGPLDSDYGVTFRLIGWKHYYFSISDAGKVLVYKRGSQEGDDSKQLYWDISASVQPGEFNELVVFAKGSHFTFCVNQQVVAELDDESYVSGRFGVQMELEQATDEAVIEYDNYTVYAPQKQTSTKGNFPLICHFSLDHHPFQSYNSTRFHKINPKP
jgi:hypothetical protein